MFRGQKDLFREGAEKCARGGRAPHRELCGRAIPAPFHFEESYMPVNRAKGLEADILFSK